MGSLAKRVNTTTFSGPLDPNVLKQVSVLVNQDNFFISEFPDLTSKYRMMRAPGDVLTSWKTSKTRGEDFVDRWTSNPKTFWQNQLNFAVYCATAACGLGKDKLNLSNKYLKAVYRFHLYFTVRKILYDIKCPIPGDVAFNQVKNPIDKRAYLDICREFKVDPLHNFKQTRDSVSNGLGTAYF